MPILIDSVNFTNFASGTTLFYRSNAGDETEAILNIRAAIRMSSIGNPLVLDPGLNQVQSPSTSWIDEGFRPGDNVVIYLHSSGGAVIQTWWSNINYCDDIMADFGPMPFWYNIANGEFISMFVVDAPGSYNAILRDELDILFNHSKTGSAGSEFSLIDAEVSRVKMSGIAALGIGGSINGILLGNQSGGFLKEASITRVTAIDQFFKYEVRIKFVNPGMYDDGSWFFSSTCLKSYMKTEWARIAGEPYAKTIGTYDLDGDTGYYDDPFNTGLNNASVIQGISELDFCVPTIADIIVDGPLADIGIGSAYLSQDVTYYKNQSFSQYNLAMIIPTQDASILGTYSSELNPSGAGYEIEINSFNQAGSETSINITFTPNPAMQAFMDSRDPSDRRFQLWIRCGNLNLLVHDDQLQCAPPVGGPLIMEQSYAFLDHGQNVNDISGNFSGFECNTEDDVAYVGRFLMDKNVIHESFSIKMEAYNSATGDDFTLQEVFFGFSAIPISGDGRYLLNESIPVINTLPGTSEKLIAVLELDPSLDTPSQYGVRIFAPWLINWKYWLQQNNASVDFWPNQDQNWLQYDDLLIDWSVRIELQLVREGLGYTHTENINIKDYDSNPFIDQNIELYVDSTNQNVGIVTEGQLMRVVGTHTLLNGQAWNPSDIWGMITVEPYEAERRWICSTIVNFDNNTSNPLFPLSGLLMAITYPAPNVARMECFFDPDLIDLSNGVKFTTKIKGCPGDAIQVKTMTDGTIKTTTFAIDKTLAI